MISKFQFPSRLTAKSREDTGRKAAHETEYCIYVPRSLVHRARWIVAQLPISDEELESLAMRKNTDDTD